MPKRFEGLSFDYSSFATQISELADLLRQDELDEREQILPFFQARPILSAQIGTFFADLSIPNKIAFEYDIFGDFACDLAVGNTNTHSYCFVEFEDAKHDSLFRTGKRFKPSFGRRLEQGASQVLDWFCKLETLQNTQEMVDRFEVPKIDYSGLLIIGRNADLNGSLRYRLEWRAQNLLVVGKKVNILSFDDLLALLRLKLATIESYRA